MKGRIIALDVRPQKFGYAVLETAGRLLDFGLSGFETPNAAARRLTSLLRTSYPTVLVLRRIRNASSRDCPRTRAVIRAICRVTRSSGLSIAWIGEGQMQRFFGIGGVHTKNQRASLLADSYPQLKSRLPQQRKLWQSENWYMTTFDAVALGVSYLASSGEAEKVHGATGSS